MMIGYSLPKQAANLEKNVQTANNYSIKEVASPKLSVRCYEMLCNDTFLVEIVNIFAIFAKI